MYENLYAGKRTYDTGETPSVKQLIKYVQVLLEL